VNKQTEKMKNEIRALYSSFSKKPSNVAKEHPTLYLRARRLFGSWKKALEACGIDYEKARNRKKWSREKVVKEIKELYLKGHSLRLKDLKKEGRISLISAAQYHFRSWRKAVEFSGIYYSFGKGKKKIIKDDKIIAYGGNKT
jgi:hypothetical protein